MKNLSNLFAFLLFLFATALGGCGRDEQTDLSWPPREPSDKSPRVLFLGVDAADWDEMDPLIAQGRLPNIAKLKSRGAFGNQNSVAGASPAIWTSIATGLPVEEHGIQGFTVENPDYDPNDSESRQFIPVNSGMRKRKAMWNLLSESGRTVGIVGWFVTWPVEPVNGYMISSYASMDINNGGAQLTGKGSFYADVDGLVYPSEMTQGTNKAILSKLASTGVEEGNKTSDRIFALYPHLAEKGRLVDETRWVFVADEIFYQISREMLKKYPTDFFAVYFAGVDVIGHRFGRYEKDADLDPPPEYVHPEDKIVLNKYYERVDQMIGELVSLVPKDTIIVMASDHGTAYKDPTHDYTGGVYLYAGKGIKPGHYTSYSDSLDFLPNILALMDEAIPTDLPRRPMDFLFDSGWSAQHRLAFRKTSLERGTSEAPSRTNMDKSIMKRLSDLSYVGKSGKSKELKVPKDNRMNLYSVKHPTPTPSETPPR